jgi:hypothetical protein
MPVLTLDQWIAELDKPEPHALLSASGSHKWLNCTMSARLEESIPEVKSEYADEGRLAHAIAELKLRKAFVEPMGPNTFNERLKVLQGRPLYQEEMLKYTDVYLDYTSKIVHSFRSMPYVAVEKRLDYSAYAPGGFGTGDFICIGGNVLHVADFKYGKGVPVDAEENPQMKLYALGAYLAYAMLYDIQIIKMSIVQPRLDSISEFETTLKDLLYWGEQIKPYAQLAYRGEGEYKPGEHCRFCRAKATCRARCEFHTALEDFGKVVPPQISNTEVGAILERAQGLVSWVKALEEYALRECLAGNEIPGWKAVEGRSKRAFINTDESFKVLMANGYDEALLYVKEPLSVAKVEELTGKTVFRELLKDQVNTPPGKPALVTVNDKRKAITRETAQDDFGDTNETD